MLAVQQAAQGAGGTAGSACGHRTHFGTLACVIGEKRLPARFYRTSGGTEPVRDWLRDLDPSDRRIVGADIKELEFDWPVGMPLCRSLGHGLWEVRSHISRGRIARLIFCIARGEMILLHGFIKKSQKTPQPDLTLAVRRKKEVER
jgi:phage-related protein